MVTKNKILKYVQDKDNMNLNILDEQLERFQKGDSPSGTISITENGEYDITEYAEADVNVPEGITVNESYDISEGTLNSATFTLEGDVVATIPDGVTTISNNAFYKNYIITKVIMPNSVLTAEDGFADIGCFSGDINLKEIVLSNNLSKISTNMFYRCTGLTTITIPDSVTSIGGSAFLVCTSLTEINLPDSLTSIGNAAFYGCTSLTEINLLDSLTSIGEEAFRGCTSLTEINLLDSLTSIGNAAFRDCTSLTEINLPDSLTSIGNAAFYGCTRLTDIYYTGTQAEWESITGLPDAGIPSGAIIHYEYTP